MGQTAELVARRYNVTREQQDLYSLQSQQRTARATEGLFSDEIVPMNVQYFTEDKNTGERTLHQGVVDRDDCNRPDTTPESLAGLAGFRRGRFGDRRQRVAAVRRRLDDAGDEHGQGH